MRSAAVIVPVERAFAGCRGRTSSAVRRQTSGVESNAHGFARKGNDIAGRRRFRRGPHGSGPQTLSVERNAHH